MPDSVLSIRLDVRKSQILELTEVFRDIFLKTQSLIHVVTATPVSGKELTSSEFKSLINSSLGGWLNEQRCTYQSEIKLSNIVEDLHPLSVNSSSSSNLIALRSLIRLKLGKRTLKPGNEIITGQL